MNYLCIHVCMFASMRVRSSNLKFIDVVAALFEGTPERTR